MCIVNNIKTRCHKILAVNNHFGGEGDEQKGEVD